MTNSPNLIASLKKETIRKYAIETLGFDECNVCSPFIDDLLDDYKTMVKNKDFQDMAYLERHLPFKSDPTLLLPKAKSAIVLIKNYKNTPEKALNQPFKIARYAVGIDYHYVIMDKLGQLDAFLKDKWTKVSTYYGVDSRPLADRTLAIKAGIGFRGKNTMVIRPKLGSYFFIAIMLTTLELPADSALNGSCGSCTACIEACPTQAISDDGKLSIKDCIGYKTIEQKTPLSKKEISDYKGWLFGCDICQEVCPFNHSKTPLTNWPEFMPTSGVDFDFLSRLKTETPQPKIPKNSPLYRSRKRVLKNVENA